LFASTGKIETLLQLHQRSLNQIAMIFILTVMARALPHLLKLLAEKAKATRENE
jgi:hypothetical protein